MRFVGRRHADPDVAAGVGPLACKQNRLSILCVRVCAGTEVARIHSPAVVDIRVEAMFNGHADRVIDDDLSWVS